MNIIVFNVFRNSVILALLFIAAGIIFNDRTLPFMLHSVASNLLYIFGAGAVLAVLPYFDGSKKLDFISATDGNKQQSRVLSSQHDIKSEDPEIRIKAAFKLGNSGNARAVISLIAALSDKDPQVRDAANSALTKLTNQDFQQDVAAWKHWWRENRDSFRG